LAVAYTFHLGKDRAAASRRIACCALPEAVHEAIFKFIDAHAHSAGGTADSLACPVFRRLDDYYADVRFGGDELPLLRAEAVRLTAEFPRDADVLKFLTGLERACRDAENGGLLLFGFAD
jgi:hypothetical protein